MKKVLGVLLCLAMPFVSLQAAPPKTSPKSPLIDASLSASAREIMQRARPSVVQIRGFFGSNSAQQFHGTGFTVAPGGVVLTNYHVVAQRVIYPDKYRLEYRTPEGRTGGVTVLAVDVLRDLAVVKTEGLELPPLTLQPQVPPKGSRAYSVGFPLDVGLTITEGVANGRVEDAFDSRIHYSGAINPGMSGGPTLNSQGQVVGVNVSGYRYEQLVSFLVPALYADALLIQAKTHPLNVADASQGRAEVARQLRQHASELLKAMPAKFPLMGAGEYKLPGKLADFVDCNASGDPSPNQIVKKEVISCDAKAGVYVEQGLQTGDLGYQHLMLETQKIDSWRFANRLEDISIALGKEGSRRHVGALQCRNRNVALHGFDANMLLCIRSYRNFEQLYDFTVRISSLNGEGKAFASHLDLSGVGYDDGMDFIRRFVDSMTASPAAIVPPDEKQP